MTEKKTQYRSVDAKKIVAEYIDQSAIRLAQRLREAYSEPKNHAEKVRSYA